MSAGDCFEQRVGVSVKSPGYIFVPLRDIACLVCGKVFRGKGRRQTCSATCQAERYAWRYLQRRPRIKRTCVICGKPYQNNYRHSKTCSAECAKTNAQQQHLVSNERSREHRRAYDREYNARQRKPAKWGQYPCHQRKMAAAKARIEARRQARDRHADIVEATRQMQALRWHVYGDGIAKQIWLNRSKPARTPQELRERKRACQREQMRRERAALKIYREMGFVASRKDRRAIYQALKAELPTLNI